MSDAASWIDALRANVARHESALVAFSGGVDSSVVLKIASEVLGTAALGVMGRSPSVPPSELADARRLAAEMGARLRVVDTDEMSDPNYVANPNNRCFHCKTELYSVCRRVAAAEGFGVLLNGTNADDPGDHRPGLIAADDAGVASPLLECGLGKQAVRDVARALGLPNWDKPALACLASRLPHGTPVTSSRLAAVDLVEQHLRGLGFRDVRARHLGERALLEVERPRVAELQELLARGALTDILDRAGFVAVDVAADGFRSGRLNPAPTKETHP